jgi:hypothetical protein
MGPSLDGGAFGILRKGVIRIYEVVGWAKCRGDDVEWGGKWRKEVADGSFGLL